MVEYYGHNDWRDYHLSHHGVLGMHWGIRRYQPYGHGGYDPKGNGGREIGEARHKGKTPSKKTGESVIKKIAKGALQSLKTVTYGEIKIDQAKSDKNVLKTIKENTQDDFVSSLMKEIGVDVKNINGSPLTNKEISAYKKLRKDYNNLQDEYDKKHEKYKRGELSYDEIRKIEDRIDLKDLEVMEFQDDLRQKYIR